MLWQSRAVHVCALFLRKEFALSHLLCTFKTYSELLMILYKKNTTCNFIQASHPFQSRVWSLNNWTEVKTQVSP